MAIYSNFDGTMRDGITIGKKGAVIKRVGTEDGISIEKSSAPGTYGTVTIANGTASNHAVTKGQLDGMFGTGDAQVRTNHDMDLRYTALASRNTNGGYAGIGADGKIESRFLPQIQLNTVIVKKNKYGRNANLGLIVGDSCIITPTPLYNAGLSYALGDVVRTMEYGVTKFYSASRPTTIPTFNAALWKNTTLEVGQTVSPGAIVIVDNKLYLVTQEYTVTNIVLDPATIAASFTPYSDAAIREWAGGVPYAKNDFVKITTPTSVKCYAARDPIPAMLVSDWDDTTLKPNTTYAIGDEVIYQNKNYMLKLAYTSPAVIVDPATIPATFAEDTAPDAGYYILVTSVAGGNVAPTTDTDWVATSSSTTVDSFNGRSGPVSSQTGDYNAGQVVMTTYSDLTSSTVQGNFQILADGRVKKTGDRMSGTLMIARGSVSSPSVALPTSDKSGMYDDGGKIAFTIEGKQKLTISATNVSVSSPLDVASNLITRVGDPQSASDAANKKYVDNKPLVLSGAAAPTTDLGKDGDVYMTVLGQGPITMPSADTWTDLATDGIVSLVVNGNSVPVAALTLNGGLTWSQSIMPAATNSSTDQYAYVMSNNSDSFVAVRRSIDTSKTTGKIVYTMDRGRSWNSATTFAGSGSYVPAAVYPDSTPYMLFSAANSDTAYSSPTGDVWTPVTLPIASPWACSAGARGCYVALAANTAAGSNIAIYQDFGNVWRQTTMASTLVWKSVATADGVNFVAVGEATGSRDTNIVNYSNNRGASWASATLPSSGRWSAVSSNGTTFVALRQNSNKAAYSSDSGRTWTEITLPAVRGWTRLIGSPRLYMALSTDSSSSSAVAVSVDGGRTWTSDITGQIADINFKNGGKWLAYANAGAGQSNNISTSTLYVRRDGDKMTGSLVLSHDSSKDSIIASGAILSPSLKATSYATNDMTVKKAGDIFMGAMNPDAVEVGNIFGYETIIQGSNSGFSLITRAHARGSDGVTTKADMMTITKDTFNLAGSVGLGGQNVAYANAALSLDISKKKHGVVIYSGSDKNSNANAEILSIASNNSGLSKFAIKIRSNCVPTGPDKDTASPFSTGDYVFGVTTNGVVDVRESLYVGSDRGAGQPVAKVFVRGTSVYDTSLDISNASMPKKAGLYLHYDAYTNADNTYKHINVEESTGSSVFLLDNVRFMVNKPVQLNTSVVKNVSLYVGGTDAVRIPAGRSNQRPKTADCEVGMMRYNTETSKYEVYTGSAWEDIQVGSKSACKQWFKDNWKKLDTPTAEGHTHSYTFITGSSPDIGGLGVSSPPFLQFQVRTAAGKFRSALFDYEVADGNYAITVFATYMEGEEPESVRYFITWA